LEALSNPKRSSGWRESQTDGCNLRFIFILLIDIHNHHS
jgi:hypothetical protein